MLPGKLAELAFAVEIFAPGIAILDFYIATEGFCIVMLSFCIAL